ncbi:hypothetical protein H4219_005985 [Mycoemilia scoparia]|uniref:Uncharacterized protein n=1 Tax=Mycoemilia scoparia TaxID=417184 RepID=A0A9W7ZLR8_9FUNG|nr:hypothetical protein H4219_005985 [Mycoemilia scoparia]
MKLATFLAIVLSTAVIQIIYLGIAKSDPTPDGTVDFVPPYSTCEVGHAICHPGSDSGFNERNPCPSRRPNFRPNRHPKLHLLLSLANLNHQLISATEIGNANAGFVGIPKGTSHDRYEAFHHLVEITDDANRLDDNPDDAAAFEVIREWFTRAQGSCPNIA